MLRCDVINVMSPAVDGTLPAALLALGKAMALSWALAGQTIS